MTCSGVTVVPPPMVTDPGAPRPAAAPRLVLLDLDGTCVDRGNQPPERTPAAIARAVAGGIHVSIATGRAYGSVLPWARLLAAGGPLICGQGAAIWEMPSAAGDPGRRLFHQPISPPTATEAVLFARERGWPFIVDAGLDLITEAALWPEGEVPPRNQPIVAVPDATTITAGGVDRVVVVLRDRPPGEADEADQLLRGAFAGRAEITRSTPAFIEVTDLGATKGQALRRLAGHLGIELAATVAVGDGYNDLDMLEAAGFAVAIAGSVDAVVARADCICLPPEQAGVADVLEALGIA